MLTGVPAVRRALFATLSQTRITCRGNALSEGQAGEVHGGDRLPWLGGNYQSLRALDWRLHIHGDAEPALEQAASKFGIRVDGFAWDEAAERAALGRDAAYLVRPDGHVALALPDQDPGALAAYAARIGLRALN